MATHVVEKTVARGGDQERFEVRAVGKLPARMAKAFQKVRPHRLDHVDRVELGAQLLS